MVLPKLSYLVFQDGFDQGANIEFDDDRSHNPIVIRRNTLGPNRITDTRGSSGVTGDTDLCCDQIQIVYEDFNQNDLLQPYKNIGSHILEKKLLKIVLKLLMVLNRLIDMEFINLYKDGNKKGLAQLIVLFQLQEVG